MSAKFYTTNRLKRIREEGGVVAAVTTVIAWTLLVCGVVLVLFNLSEFNDRNLGLMVGIGFLVGSVFIYTIGTNMHLVQARKANGRRVLEGRKNRNRS